MRASRCGGGGYGDQSASLIAAGSPVVNGQSRYRSENAVAANAIATKSSLLDLFIIIRFLIVLCYKDQRDAVGYDGIGFYCTPPNGGDREHLCAFGCLRRLFSPVLTTKQLEPAVEGNAKNHFCGSPKAVRFRKGVLWPRLSRTDLKSGGPGSWRLIGSESVFVPIADPKRKTVSFLAENIGPELRKMWPILVALRHDNPAISYHMSHPQGPALMIRDLLPDVRMDEDKKCSMNSIWSWKCEERLSLSLSFSRPDIIGIVTHRSRGPFTERDRSMFNLLRFHVSQACEYSEGAVFTTPSGAMIEALESLVGGSIVTGGRWRQGSVLVRISPSGISRASSRKTSRF